MTQVMFKGQAINTSGRLPLRGDDAPEFSLTREDLVDVTLADFTGKRVILSILPSIDTPVCSLSARKFNEYANRLEDVVVLCVSADLPFALKRFCANEDLRNIIMASTFRHPQFGTDYGVTILEGPLAGLLARAIVVINKDRKILHTEMVPEITQEPNYELALSALDF